jgi:hypothetical protein
MSEHKPYELCDCPNPRPGRRFHCAAEEERGEDLLIAWASVKRNDVVRAASAAGVSKNRIHVLTGIARTTIDRILASEGEADE